MVLTEEQKAMDRNVKDKALSIVTDLMTGDLSPAEAMAILSLAYIAMAKSLEITKEDFLEGCTHDWDVIKTHDQITEH
jgi:phage I-like protein